MNIHNFSVDFMVNSFIQHLRSEFCISVWQVAFKKYHSHVSVSSKFHFIREHILQFENCYSSRNMTTPAFAIVVFEEHNEVEVIPNFWLTTPVDAYWPPYKAGDRQSRAVRNAEEPTSTWKTHPCHVISAHCKYKLNFHLWLCSQTCLQYHQYQHAKVIFHQIYGFP